MKKNEKVVIIVLVIITIALVVLGINLRKGEDKKVASVSGGTEGSFEDLQENENGEKNNNNGSNNGEEKIPSLDEENIAVLEDGTRYNTSEALKKEKEIDGLKVTEIQLTEKGNQTILLGTVTNNTSSTKGDYYVNVTLVDKEGKDIVVLPAYISELKAGESEQLNTQATLDYANAYDFKIAKQ